MHINPAEGFSYAETPVDLKRLKSALREALAMAGHRPPEEAHRRVLNLACGRADETGTLAEILGEGASSLEIVCSDLRRREIEEARTRWAQPRGGAIDTRFVAEDATKLFDRHALPENFDVAVLRHQNFWNGPELWSEIFDKALHRLEEDGILLITSYFDLEHDLACEALDRLGARLVADRRNVASRELDDAPGKSVDRHIAVFRRNAGAIVSNSPAAPPER
jgi:SAM-dependent methyltransferase